jgi:RNA polymerase-binding transcription factor DksA
MRSAEIQTYRRRLAALRARLAGAESQLEEDMHQPSGGETSGSLSNLPVHLADLGSHEYEEEINETLLGNEEQLLAEVEAALDRLAQGTFGRCERCRQEIPAGRLRAVPYARFCLSCARKWEAANEPAAPA